MSSKSFILLCFLEMVRTSTEGGHDPVQDVRVKTELRRASPGEGGARMVFMQESHSYGRLIIYRRADQMRKYIKNNRSKVFRCQK